MRPITDHEHGLEEYVTDEPTPRSPRDPRTPARRSDDASGTPVSTPERMDAIARLAGVVSHDFSNLLTVILGHADMLLDVSADNPAVRNSVLEIKNAAESGARVAADLLAISERQSLRPAPIDLNAIIRQLSETLCQILGEHIDVRFDLAQDLPLVEADPAQFERVLRAVAVHEREIMPQGGRVTVVSTIERRAGSTDVVVRILDTASHAAVRSLEPMFTGKKPSRGAGLSLTTAHGIIHQSGGSLAVSSLNGRGAVITIMLPARDAGGFLPRS